MSSCQESTCPVCKEEEEDWEHYDYECNPQKSGGPGGARSPFRKEKLWLEEEKISEREMLMLAKARWIYHCERCNIDMK